MILAEAITLYASLQEHGPLFVDAPAPGVCLAVDDGFHGNLRAASHVARLIQRCGDVVDRALTIQVHDTVGSLSRSRFPKTRVFPADFQLPVSHPLPPALGMADFPILQLCVETTQRTADTPATCRADRQELAIAPGDRSQPHRSATRFGQFHEIVGRGVDLPKERPATAG